MVEIVENFSTLVFQMCGRTSLVVYQELFDHSNKYFKNASEAWNLLMMDINAFDGFLVPGELI